MKTLIKYFQDYRDAWRFMHICDDLGIQAGFPSLNDNDGQGYSVQYRPL